MAGKTISEFTDAGALQGSDYFLIDRGSSTLKVSGSTVTNSITSSASGAFASKTDLTSLSSTVDTNFALKSTITSLSSTVDDNFIPQPASASAQQVLTYNGSTTTWVASAAPNGSTGPTSAKAWVNFDGTTSPGTIRSSLNVSSITKSGTGEYTVNIPAGILADANYSVVGSSTINSVPNAYTIVFPFTTTSSPFYIAPTQTSFRVLVASGLTSGSQADSLYINIQVFGN